MTVIEITLLVIGAIIFIAGFIIPERGKQHNGVSAAKVDDMVKKAIEKEIPSIQDHIKATVDETVEYAIEKTERSMAKVSNEKIMAVNEYANTIIEEMNKDHQEVMFLYDMLNEKQIDIKNTINRIHATKSEVESAMDLLNEQLEQEKSILQPLQNQSAANTSHVSGRKQETIKNSGGSSKVNSSTKANNASKIGSSSKANSSLNSKSARSLSRDLGIEAFKPFSALSLEQTDQANESAVNNHKAAKQSQTESRNTELRNTEQRIQGDRRTNTKTEINHNQRILKLKDEGKTNVEIAQILGLGLGEVKLVIDLFEGASS
ncbi:MAG: hypothetical protein GX567_03560 [Clostridia bacterium]|nr:hypothetical protein [Clostridia bacterium]